MRKLAEAGFDVQLQHIWDRSFRHRVELLGPDRRLIFTDALFTARSPPCHTRSAGKQQQQRELARKHETERKMVAAATAARTKGFGPAPEKEVSKGERLRMLLARQLTAVGASLRATSSTLVRVAATPAT